MTVLTRGKWLARVTLGLLVLVVVMATGYHFKGFMDRLIGQSEFQESSYRNREAVVADGAIPRGWIPDWLPYAASDIRECHILDTNQTWMSFRFAAEDRSSLEAACGGARIAEVEFPARDKRVSWWPHPLTRDSQTGREEYDLVVCEDRQGTVYLALEKGKPQAWFWRL